MKKILLAVTALTCLATLAKAQLSIAPEAGLNMATMAMKVTDLAGGSFTYDTHMKAGIAVGAVVDIGIVKGFCLQPGLLYEMAGTNFTATDEHPGGHWDLNTVTLPLNFEYKTGHIGGNRFFVGIGPYAAYNLSGSYSYDANDHYNYYKATGNLAIGSSKGTDYMKALDFGVGVNVGYQLAMGLYIKGHYQMGLTNLCPFADAHDSYKTSAFGVSVGYYLPKRNGGSGVK